MCMFLFGTISLLLMTVPTHRTYGVYILCIHTVYTYVYTVHVHISLKIKILVPIHFTDLGTNKLQNQILTHQHFFFQKFTHHHNYWFFLVHLAIVRKLYNQQAAAYFHMKITHIPINEETRKVDINAMRRAINKNTCVVSWSHSGTFIVHHIDLLKAANALCSPNMKAYFLIL